jgi:hypothetical protein
MVMSVTRIFITLRMSFLRSLGSCVITLDYVFAIYWLLIAATKNDVVAESANQKMPLAAETVSQVPGPPLPLQC